MSIRTPWRGLLITALAAFAFGTTTAASATTLCSTASSPCSGTTYLTGATIAPTTSGGTVVVRTSGGLINPTLTCTSSTLRFQTVSDGGQSGWDVNIELMSASFAGCTSVNPSGCSSSLTTTYLFETGWIEATATPGTGTLSILPPVFSLSCPALGTALNCSYGGGGGGNFVSGTLVGSSTAPTLTFTNQTLTIPGGAGPFCPTGATFSATYRSASPSALFVEDA